jgi:hypothetical protein
MPTKNAGTAVVTPEVLDAEVPFTYGPDVDELRERRHRARAAKVAGNDRAPWERGTRTEVDAALGDVADANRRARVVRPTRRTGGGARRR